MPYRRKYGGYRKKYVRRYTRKKGWWKRKTRKYTGQYGVRMFKLKQVSTLTSNAGGIMQMDLPSRDASGAQDWSPLVSLFDQYRVCAVKVKYIPQLPNDTSTVTGFFPFYVGYDSEAAAIPVSSVNAAIQYENIRIYNMYRPWSYYTKVPKTSQQGSDLGWIELSAPLTSGRVFGYGTGFDVSTQYGTVVETFYLMAKSRR